MTRKSLWLWLSLSLVACARSARPTGEEVMDFKSSLVVLLEHREELALSPEQVQRFEQMDFTLQEKNQQPRWRIEELRAQNATGPKPSSGSYMGGGTHDVYGGKGNGTGMSAVSTPEDAQRMTLRRQRFEQMEAALREMQSNDSKAYVEAEKLLREEQKPRARELFSKEREKLLKQLEARNARKRRGEY
jgi:hypothetical protein